MPSLNTYHQRKAEGLCPQCGSDRDDADFLTCSECRRVEAIKRQFYSDFREEQQRIRKKLEPLFGWLCAQGKHPREDYAI